MAQEAIKIGKADLTKFTSDIFVAAGLSREQVRQDYLDKLLLIRSELLKLAQDPPPMIMADGRVATDAETGEVMPEIELQTVAIELFLDVDDYVTDKILGPPDPAGRQMEALADRIRSEWRARLCLARRRPESPARSGSRRRCRIGTGTLRTDAAHPAALPAIPA